MPTCLKLLMHCMRRAASRAAWTAGKSKATRIAMMAITTNSSTNVNAPRCRESYLLTELPSKFDPRSCEQFALGFDGHFHLQYTFYIEFRSGTNVYTPALDVCVARVIFSPFQDLLRAKHEHETTESVRLCVMTNQLSLHYSTGTS